MEYTQKDLEELTLQLDNAYNSLKSELTQEQMNTVYSISGLEIKLEKMCNQ